MVRAIKALHVLASTTISFGSMFGLAVLGALVPPEPELDVVVVPRVSAPVVWLADIPTLPEGGVEAPEAPPAPPAPPAPRKQRLDAPVEPVAEPVEVAVAEVAPDPAALARAARLERVRAMRAKAQKERPEKPEGSEAGTRGKRGQKCLEAPPEITQVSEFEYQIQKELVDLYLSDLSEAEKLAWVDWHRDEGGEIVGFVVKRVRCGSPLYAAGMRNGDVVMRINSREVTSIPQALRAYRRLKKKDDLRLIIHRGEEEIRLTYELI